ncbi:protein kinase domain-containing protein [Pendulispora albinea]|uniref:Protein kinase n=1 Tax=Pendulispora albinea TaxID=2741071 RepID=A0ABZ2MC77_9BACT
MRRSHGTAPLFADRFAIEEEAGVGALGIVYRAVDRVTSGQVALKVIHPHRAPEIGRFVTEISVLAGIHHPAIIRYLSHGISIDDERFLVMEWLPGETLAKRLVHGPLSFVQVLTLAHRLAEGLDALHTSGIAHGDLKPSNVYLPSAPSSSGAASGSGSSGGGEGDRDRMMRRAVAQAKLLDFGLPVRDHTARAPDFKRAVRVDLFALGSVIVHALTGKPSPAPETMPSPSSELAPLLGRLLHPNPEERPESAADVRDELERILEAQPAALREPSWRSRRAPLGVGDALGFEHEPMASMPPVVKTLSSAPSAPTTGSRARHEGPRVSVAPNMEVDPKSAEAEALAATERAVLPPHAHEKDGAASSAPSSRISQESERGLRAGMTFAGRYLLQARVGVGGMGELFRAFDTRLRRSVALKVLHRERALHAPTESSARILREARAAAALSHANVVAIHDVGEHEGVPFIAMEYVEGQSLRAFVGTSYPPFETRLGWMIDVARALAAAHEKGLVHRDIKPDNVMIRDDGTVKVLDFGIARYREGPADIELPHAGSDDETSDLAMTNTRVVGTPGYMAPEQTRGDRIDGRADQFSWGVVAFEVFSGSLPWVLRRGGLSVAAVALSEDPKPLGDAVPAHVANVILRTLAKAEGERFPTMRDVVSALGASPDVTGNQPAISRSLGGAGAPDASSREPQTTPPSLRSVAEGELARSATTGKKHAGGSRSWLSGRRSTLLVVALCALMIATVVVGRLRNKTPPKHDAHEAAALPAGTFIIAHPASPKCSPSAVAHYRDGLAALREANWELAAVAFERAAAADPSCPEAQLRRLMSTMWYDPIGRQREHFRLAAELRDALSDRDRVLFDSMLPLVIMDPPDRELAWRIVEVGLERFPRDAELLLTAGTIRLQLPLDEAALEHGLELAKRATDIDPKYADAWQAQGRILARLGRLDDELSALEECLRTSPGAADCMHDRVLILRWRGRCSELAQETRRWIARAPNSGSAYWQLALALAQDGAPDETIEEAVRQQLSHAVEHHSARWLNAMAHLAAFRGDFDKAERLATQLAKETSGDPSLLWHLRPAMMLIDTAEETGHFERASAVAEQFLKRKAVWTIGDPTPELMSYEPSMFGSLLRHGRITAADWLARGNLWEASVAGRLGKLDSWAFLWGPVSETRDFAARGWRQMPPLSERTPSVGFNGFDLRLAGMHHGRVALGAGDYARAIEWLEPAAKSCMSFEQPFANTRSHLWLGDAKERSGDKAGACEAYRVVVQRWGNAKPSSKTAEEARRRARAMGCSIR